MKIFGIVFDFHQNLLKLQQYYSPRLYSYFTAVLFRSRLLRPESIGEMGLQEQIELLLWGSVYKGRKTSVFKGKLLYVPLLIERN